LHEDVATYFARAERKGFKEIAYTSHETLKKDHGRLEQRRRCWTTSDVEWSEQKAEWQVLHLIAMVEAEGAVVGKERTE